MVNNIVAVSDLHGGCQFGLCPIKGIRLDGGGYYVPSVPQKKVKQWFDIFWHEHVPILTRGEKFAVCVNGDVLDGRHHKSVTQVSQNLSDQRNIALELLYPIVEMCATDENGNRLFYMTRGTEAHVGSSAESEEILAESLGAIPDEHGNHARNDLWLRIGGENGCLIHFAHHIGTTGTTHYESSAVNKELIEEFNEACRWNYQAPDVVIRSHRHRHIKVELDTHRGYGISEVTPGWQLKTPFAYRVSGGRIASPQFGGVVVRQGDEEFYTRHKAWSISHSKTVEL
jgi:hypothetical protein